MPRSRRFRKLVKRLDVLGAHFLPSAFSPVGHYRDQEYDLARAYVVLAHAEIEAYCEDRARERASRAFKTWQKHNRCSKLLIRLLAFHNIDRRLPWRVVIKTEDAIQAAVNSYNNAVQTNNGIREDNLLRILFPIGIQAKDLSTTWLATVDSFGRSRGTIAHTSIHTQQPIDPSDELEKVKLILVGLAKLDSKLGRLK